MNICDSTGTITILRNYGKEFSSFKSFLGRLIILMPAILLVSGCGSYKEELEAARQQIVKLNSENSRLNEETGRLNQEKNRLTEESKIIMEKNAQLSREVGALIKAKASITSENKDLRDRNTAAEEQIASLRTEKEKLAKDIEGLKKAAIEPTQLSSPLAPDPVAPQGKKTGEMSPCDAVIAYMKASQPIIRQLKGTERAEALERLKQQYAPGMKGAPENAVKAAENWVQDVGKFWDQSKDDAAFTLLRLRNTVLGACGKSPDEAGF